MVYRVVTGAVRRGVLAGITYCTLRTRVRTYAQLASERWSIRSDAVDVQAGACHSPVRDQWTSGDGLSRGGGGGRLVRWFVLAIVAMFWADRALYGLKHLTGKRPSRRLAEALKTVAGWSC